MRWPTGRTFRASALPLVLGLALFGCTSRRPPSTLEAAGPGRRPVITVASFAFPESELLADIYARALRARGYPVRVLANAGSRELLEPALARGLVQFVPEYAGSALEFASLGRDRATSDVRATHAALARALDPWGVVPLAPSPAQDANAVVVSERTARLYGLRSVGDLAGVASRLVFGGPPECPERAFCLRGLRGTYGLTFKQFVPLDVGGPLTVQALRAGGIDVALLFTTDPAIRANHLVALADDRGLQPAENITPVVRKDVLARYDAALARAVDAVSARLTTEALTSLNAMVTVEGASPAEVAARWLPSADTGGA